MSERQSTVDRGAFAEAIRRMDEADLHYLNHLIVERIKLISQARSTAMLSRFAPGDHVTFVTLSGERKTGIILKLNKKTTSIRTDDGHNWKVHPSFLSPVIETSTVTVRGRELGNG